jgi:methionine salvage enolase-phosphatase E1
MFKLRNIYLYLVCFVTLLMMIFGTISTVQGVTDLLYPTNYYAYPVIPDKNTTQTPDEQKQQEANRKSDQENQKNQNKKNVAKSVAVVLVALPTFAYHWKKIEKEKKDNG